MHLIVLILALVTVLGKDVAVEPKPTLRLVSIDPVTVRGQAFEPRERVRLVALGSLQRVSVRTTTDERGTFKTSFPPLGADRCSPLVVAAVGSRGSRASVKVLRRPCQPPRVPPARR